MMITKGTVVQIRKGWDLEWRRGVALTAPFVAMRQLWVAVLWNDAEDPETFKTAGLDVVVAKVQGIP